MRVLVFGDSIAQGFYDTQGGWSVHLWEYYTKLNYKKGLKNPPTVFNLGISGDTTEAILKRFKSETEARKYPGEEFAFIFATGTNDTVYRGTENDSEPEKYEQQLEELIAQAKTYSPRIICIGLFPVVDKLLQPMSWSTTGKCYSSSRMKLFDETLKNFCFKNNLPFVDLFTPFSQAKNLESLFADGVHPNDTGHELIASLIKPELDKLF